MNTITGEELAEVMRGIIANPSLIDFLHSVGWVDGENLRVKNSEGWTLVFFIDVEELDYLDSATSPDGREWEYYHDGIDPTWEDVEPLSDLLSQEEHAKLETILERWILA